MDIFVVICVAGPVFELGALLLLVRNGLWRSYTSFFVYLTWLLVGNSAILIASVYFPGIYPTLYWHIDSIDVVLRFLVIWEVFHQIFPKTSGLNRSLSKGFGLIAFGLLAFGCATFLIYQNYTGPRSIHLALDRSFAFVQALMILGTLVAARYYGVRCGRNIRGIALAFGGWMSISTATNAMADLTTSFITYWYYLRPLSFVVMIAVWIWALWIYDPNPPIVESEPVELGQWTEDWNRTISAARTIIRP
ncbi:MAG: hypothetical protein DMG32_02760 [Acidobacteria bacterium]|nr:MAG: hypothetical protein DMG32_02760 [Acidobacteriota bacterium]